MKLPRDLSGRQLAKALGKAYGYTVIHQSGSHMILQTHEARPHRLAVPDHSALRVGTLNSILRAVADVQNCSKHGVLSAILQA
jgi:predicted RNA binding protein YcfA (HicA-like mRNA interferase family)